MEDGIDSLIARRSLPLAAEALPKFEWKMGFEGRSPREDTFENKYHYPRNPQNNTPSFTLQVRAQNALLLYDVGGCLQAQEHHTIKKARSKTSLLT